MIGLKCPKLVGAFAAFSVFAAALAGPARAQSTSPAATYPTKPIRLVVPTQPGGSVDIIARLIGKSLTDAWAQASLVDNRAGATGNIGLEMVAKAPPDGYTLLVATNAMLTINPHLSEKLAFDPLRDFSPITVAASSPFLLVVHPKIGVSSVKELIVYARAHPGELNYSSSGNGSATHLAGVLFANMAGVNMVHVPYKGSSTATSDLLSGQIQTRFSAALPVVQFIRDGKLRAIAISTARRNVQFPDVPTVAESLPGYQSDIWFGVLAPARTPPALVGKLNGEIIRQLNGAEIRDKLSTDGLDVIGNSPAEFAAQIRTEYQRWAPIVKESGARAD